MMVFCLAVVDSHATSAKSATGYIDSYTGVNVRAGASTSTSRVFGLRNNTKVTITQEVFASRSQTSSSSKWYRISYNGKIGYVRADLIDGISYTATTGTTTDTLNYRIGAGTSMKRLGTLRKGTGVTVLLDAKAINSNVAWYKIKIGGGYRYVCATWVDLKDSIFVDPGNGSGSGSGGGSGSSTGGGSGSSTGSNTEKTFEQQLSEQGFPEDYKVYLRKLHAAHPNWVFKAKKTNIAFNTVVSKESANGVSLVESSWPLAYRDTSSYSFKAGAGRDVYRTASTSASKVGHIDNNAAFTILDEVFTANSSASKYKWTHVKMANGTKGYVQGAVTNESYSNTVTATAQGGTNIRKGAGSAMTWIKTLGSNTQISIVLTTKDSSGKTWYKFKYGSGYAYICGSYVTLSNSGSSSSTSSVSSSTTTEETDADDSTVSGKTTESLNFRNGPGQLFKKTGTFSSGTAVKIIGKVTACDNSTWYKLNKDGNVVYAVADYIKADAAVTSAQASVPGVTTDALNYRKTYSTSGSRMGTFSKNTKVIVTGIVKADKHTWYRLNVKGQTGYAVADYITLSTETVATKAATTVSKTTTASTAATASSVSLSSLAGTGKIVEGTYIPKDGSTWFNANSQTVAYFVDPRNFLNEDRVYMFEDLSYQSAYQTAAVVSKVLSGTALAKNGYQAAWFVSAGAQYNVSPVSLAARARQETGGGSIACSGWSSGGSIYYNPFNIGAYSGSNPVMNGMNYAKSMGWNTKQKAVNGGAKMIAGSYINKGQNSIYFQRFNVANGVGSVATHQYMTNLMAPYSEALTTKNTYSAYGITNEALTFVIPVYTSMPTSTSLPS